MARITRRRSFAPVLDVLDSRIAPGGIAFEPLPVTHLDAPSLVDPMPCPEEEYDEMAPPLVIAEMELPNDPGKVVIVKTTEPDHTTVITSPMIVQ